MKFLSNCKTCKKNFEVKSSYYIGKRKYCGFKCRDNDPEFIKKISDSKLGDKNPAKRPEVKAKIIKNLKHGDEIRGDKNPNWRGGIAPLNYSLRRSYPYKIWRKQVLKRDNYKCVNCNSTENLHVDHIKPFSLFEKLRLVVSNGRVLCAICHLDTPTFAGRCKNFYQ